MEMERKKKRIKMGEGIGEEREVKNEGGENLRKEDEKW
jgi:hypothetical protein